MERSIPPFFSLFIDYMQQSSKNQLVLMFEMFFCVVGCVKLYLLVTLNNDFLPQLKCAVFGAFKTALLRSGASASGHCEHISSNSVHSACFQQA